MPKISIVVPIYNVDKYLNKCLDSIINQTFVDFECVCINDGSTDRSLQILQDYINKDKRFKLINQINKGISYARNKGIEISCGEYITFIDSDDWIEITYLEKLYSTMLVENADIVSCNFKFYYSKDNFFETARVRKLDIVKNEDDDCGRLYNGYHGAYVWRKLYKSEIIKKNNIKFYDGKTSEDGPFSGLVYLYAKKIVFVCEGLYFHRKQINSLTSNTERQDYDALINIILLTNEIQSRGFDNNTIKKFLIDTFIYKLGKLSKVVSREKQKILLVDILKHIEYLLAMSKSINFIYTLKMLIVKLMVQSLDIKTFKILRVLKNII